MLRVILPFVFAFGLAGLFIIQAYIPFYYSGDTERFSWSFVSWPLILRYGLWALFYLWLRQHFLSLLPQTPFLKVQNLFRLVLIALVAFVHSALIYVFYVGYGWLFQEMEVNAGLLEHVIRTVYAGTVTSVVELVVLLLLLSGLDYLRRSQQQKVAIANMEKQLSQARLTALQMQLNPHFLFNAFNSIVSLIDTHQEKAKDMLVELSSIMRELLNSDKRPIVTLQDEVAFAKRYLEIEKLRFGERLQLTFDIASETRFALVPNLLLQPILENSFKHGFTNQLEECVISVIAFVDKAQLNIVISDNGKQSDTNVSGFGVGLNNIKERLEQLYDDDYSLDFSCGQNGAKTHIVMPAQVTNREDVERKS